MNNQIEYEALIHQRLPGAKINWRIDPFTNNTIIDVEYSAGDREWWGSARLDPMSYRDPAYLVLVADHLHDNIAGSISRTLEPFWRIIPGATTIVEWGPAGRPRDWPIAQWWIERGYTPQYHQLDGYPTGVGCWRIKTDKSTALLAKLTWGGL